MKQSRLFIGNDSGLMHLAALSELPTIGLFGPSDVKKYSPVGLKTLVIKTSKGYKELMGYVGFDPKNVESLMKDLSVSEVFSKTLKFYREVK
jgi:ADP-heptose:LPS heptosyltransferase